MAHKKTAGSVNNGRDSIGKRLGVKIFGGQVIEKNKIGSIIVRQRGEKIRAGKNVSTGKDHTLFSLCAGKVQYNKKRENNRIRTYVSVVPF